jgi:DNA-binding transcriptional MerR regulator
VSSRTYLSIGDVLTLLREEFPDVTISKIRFLESQGLVNPERSPSGYRKFFEHDVERLRWVLRQQREHFLPLKVIRDRLADGELDDAVRDGENGKATEVGGVRSGAADAARDDEQPTKADEEAMARILADASRRTALMPDGAQALRGLQVLGEDAAPAEAGEVGVTPAAAAAPAPASASNSASASASAQGASAPSAAPAAGEPAGATAAAPPAQPPPQPSAPAAASHGVGPRHAAPSPAPGAPTAPPAPSPAPAAAPASAAAKSTGRANGTPQATRAEAPPPASASASRTPEDPPPPAQRGGAKGGGAAGDTPATSIVTGASLTSDELCAASGLSREEVVGLQGFGLICPVVVAGMETYDEEALTVANLAAAFRAYGIEARHLRLYRNAADRELGLIEQVVIPLLRQRNPESRQRAVEAADQLAALGQSMRASLLRQALHQHFGG